MQNLKINMLQSLMSIIQKYNCLFANSWLGGGLAVIYPKC